MMLNSVLSAAWLFVSLPDSLSDCLPDALPSLALVRVVSDPTPNSVIYKGDVRSVPPQSSGVGSAAGMTREEARAIDARFLEKWHWKLSPGTCEMLGCTVHGGGWIRVAGPTPSKPTTHIEYRRAGLFGRQRVAVEVENAPADAKQQPTSDEGVRRSDALPTARPTPGDSLLPVAAPSCPGGSCLGGT